MQYREGGERVFVEKVYWIVTDGGESVNELMIKKTVTKTVHSTLYLGVFNFCTCCIQICIVCFVAGFKLCCV